MIRLLKKLLSRRVMVRAASKKQKEDWLKHDALHSKLASELGREWRTVRR